MSTSAGCSVIGTGSSIYPETIPSAAALGVYQGFKTFNVTGTTAITSIVLARSSDEDDIPEGMEIRLEFAASCTLTDNANIVLTGSANYSATAGDTIQLFYDGDAWREDFRSVD